MNGRSMAEAGDQFKRASNSPNGIPLTGFGDLGATSRAGMTTRAERSNALRVAVDEAATRSAESMLALRIAVVGFTSDLRDTGMTPEAVLIALKKVVRQRTDFAGIMMREKISTWCIEEFFSQK